MATNYGTAQIVQDGLIVYYDPGNSLSFNVGVGSSATVTDLMGNFGLRENINDLFTKT